MTHQASRGRAGAGSTRRAVVVAAGAAGLAAALAACGDGGEGDNGDGGNGYDGGRDGQGPQDGRTPPQSGQPPTPDGEDRDDGGDRDGDDGGTGRDDGALARAGQIPVGGGAVFKARKVVVTQPTAGTFKGFSAVCRHQGCIVGDVSGGTINCPCHGSKYDITDGSVKKGPATSGLPAVDVRVENGTVKLD